MGCDVTGLPSVGQPGDEGVTSPAHSFLREEAAEQPGPPPVHYRGQRRLALTVDQVGGQDRTELCVERKKWEPNKAGPV